MKKLITASLLMASACLLTACFHSSATTPPGYCGQLKTQINRFQSNNINQQRITAANQSVLINQYQTLDCANSSNSI